MATLTIDPQVFIQAAKDLQSLEDVGCICLAVSCATKNRGRLPKNFNPETHGAAYHYYKTKVEPLLRGEANADGILTDDEKQELLHRIDESDYFESDEKTLVKDMLEMWWGRGKYARTEMIYTQSMCSNRTGVTNEKFVELRKWLKAQDVLDWENRPYNDYITSFHTINERKFLELLRDEYHYNLKK